MIRLNKVTGRSLQPVYRDGDFVISSKIPFLFGKVRGGDVIVFHHSIYGTLIKQIEWLNRDRDEIFVVGLHDDSIDSRQFGPISYQDVVGKVIAHIKKPGS